MKVWAFNKVDNSECRKKVYQSFKNGISRFGWSQKDKHNLKGDKWSEWHSKQLFLLQIKKGDWIVHINTPSYGKCIAGQVKSDYKFDEGLDCWNAKDFRHSFEIEKNSIIEFNRNDKNILPTVNLKPRQRYHRVYAVNDFLKSIENLKNNAVNLKKGESKEVYHLRDKTERYLKEITQLIHNTHKSKNLERFMANVFRKLPNVVDVNENGFGWKTDYGADLIVTTKSSIGNLEFENKIVVQIKSFEGKHYDLNAVEQVKTGIDKFNANAGIIITTAERTEQLEDKIQQISIDIDKPIDLIAGEDVAKFVIKYASDLIFKLEMN